MKTVDSVFNETTETTESAPVIIFGAGILGKMAIAVLRHQNKEINCVFDNNMKRHGCELDGFIIRKPDLAANFPKSTKVYICVYNDENFRQIENQLKQLGFSQILRKDELYRYYQEKIMQRPISHYDQFDLNLERARQKEQFITLGNVSLVITEKCTLRCIDCGVLIPYYAQPKNHDTESIVWSIQRLSQSVDVIENLTIIGGEPFLHQDLARICLEASRMSNILRVTLTTNGTILPDDALIEQLRQSVYTVTISDYGPLSSKKEALTKALKEKIGRAHV